MMQKKYLVSVGTKQTVTDLATANSEAHSALQYAEKNPGASFAPEKVEELRQKKAKTMGDLKTALGSLKKPDEVIEIANWLKGRAIRIPIEPAGRGKDEWNKAVANRCVGALRSVTMALMKLYGDKDTRYIVAKTRMEGVADLVKVCNVTGSICLKGEGLTPKTRQTLLDELNKKFQETKAAGASRDKLEEMNTLYAKFEKSSAHVLKAPQQKPAPKSVQLPKNVSVNRTGGIAQLGQVLSPAAEAPEPNAEAKVEVPVTAPQGAAVSAETPAASPVAQAPAASKAGEKKGSRKPAKK